jgi:hypothetical protein
MTTATGLWATHLASYADQIAATLPPLQLPPGLPGGARLTLMADHERAQDAAELAQLIAAGIVPWETDYAHLAAEQDPQAAAAQAAIEEALDAIGDYRAALTGAHTASQRR